MQQQQQQQQMMPVMSSFPPSNITTDQIQKYLDENKKLILAILENQNLGKLAECAQYQALLQKNLMYLAAIADAQPQAPAPAVPTQMAPHPVMQQGGIYMQHPQAAAMTQQQGLFAPKMNVQFNNSHQMQDQQHQLLQKHQHGIPQQMGIRPGGTNNGMHSMHAEPNLGGVGQSAPSVPDARGGNKKDNPEAGSLGADGQATSAAGQVSEEPK